MGSEWQTVKFSDVCDIWRGGSPRPIHEWLVPQGIPWVKISDATAAGSRYIERTKEFIRPEGRTKSREVVSGDLILSNSATPGLPMLMAIDACIHDGWLLLRNFKGIDKLFCYYLLLHERPNLVRQGSGSVFTNLKTAILKNHVVRIPPVREQQAIACILGTLDDKIELNRRMNQTLEGIARAIFKSWFVDFDPVRANRRDERRRGEPMCSPPPYSPLAPHIADLFPDAFEESELGEIPQGWEVGTLGMIVNEMRDTVQPAEIDPRTPYIALQHMPRRCISLDSWDIADDVASTKLSFKTGDILFGKLRPYFHKVGPAPLDGVCSTDIVVCRSQDDLWYSLALGHMSSDAFVAYTNIGSTGTKMPRTNWRYMSAFKIALPPSQVAARFSEIMQPMIGRIRHSIFEQQNLAALRDTLLPKLISGELRVPDAERILGRCV
jgi:type I restriction enzyme S subunit